MAINFPSTAGQATDGSYTYTVAGITYAWDGTSWEAAGAGASATDRTLFSVTQNAVGTAALSYNNNSGVFSYTPPDLSGYLTTEADTLATVTSRGASTNVEIQANGGISLPQGQSIDFGTDFSISRFLNQNKARIRYTGPGDFNFEIDDVNFRNSANNKTLMTLRDGGGVSLYYNNNIKLSSTNTGVTVSGALTAGGLTYPTTNGTSGQVLTSDGSGNVTWTAGGLQSRTTALVTQTIANGAVANLSITTPKTYVLYSIQTSHAAWVTLYSDTASRTADASRAETTDPTPGSGVLAEVITNGAVTQLITPGTICFNSAASGITYAKVVNKSGSTANVSVTLTYLQLEA